MCATATSATTGVRDAIRDRGRRTVTVMEGSSAGPPRYYADFFSASLRVTGAAEGCCDEDMGVLTDRIDTLRI